MKPFNLEAVKSGAKLCTQYGNEVKIRYINDDENYISADVITTIISDEISNHMYFSTETGSSPTGRLDATGDVLFIEETEDVRKRYDAGKLSKKQLAHLIWSAFNVGCKVGNGEIRASDYTEDNIFKLFFEEIDKPFEGDALIDSVMGHIWDDKR